jgi:hypothetical protein
LLNLAAYVLQHLGLQVGGGGLGKVHADDLQDGLLAMGGTAVMFMMSG